MTDPRCFYRCEFCGGWLVVHPRIVCDCQARRESVRETMRRKLGVIAKDLAQLERSIMHYCTEEAQGDFMPVLSEMMTQIEQRAEAGEL